MSAEKTKALVLKEFPYQESSSILYLFSENHGLIHGIAKGIRRNTKTRVYVERGFLIEALVYSKPHSELHTLGAISVVEYFPSVRTDLLKSALRDTAFETILSAITAPHIHPELYSFFVKFLQHIDQASGQVCYPFSLWLFYHRLSEHLGFGMSFTNCVGCGALLTDTAFLSAGKGGLECDSCCTNGHEVQRIPPVIRKYLHTGNPKPGHIRSLITPAVSKNVTRLLSDYCRYHFESHHESKALAFLDGLTPW
jgi:DNA repair protein RecO (recombination protein O)